VSTRKARRAQEASKMFESIVSEILTKYLGKFVKGLDKENLKIAIWGGDVVLKDLEIRVSALANLNLPVAVKSGTRHLQPVHDASFYFIYIRC
jgi:vacuolar protein sorting-associated protein 13A/C